MVKITENNEDNEIIELLEEDDQFVTDDEEEDTEVFGIDEEDDEDDDLENESILDRLNAIRNNLLTYNQKKFMYNLLDTTQSVAGSLYWFLGGTAWFLATAGSIMLLPVSLELEKEQALISQDNQMRVQQAQAQEVNLINFLLNLFFVN